MFARQRNREGKGTKRVCGLSRRAGIYGLPDLTEADQRRVALGNETMRATVQIVSCCVQAATLVILENPHSSMLWFAPEVKELLKHVSCLTHVCDFCQFGTAWRKRTRFASWCGSAFKPLTKKICKQKGKICSSTLAPHVRLTGHSASGKCFLTRKAEAYPDLLAAMLADWLAELCIP